MTTTIETPATTTTTESEITLLTMRADELRNGLQNAILFASKDDTIPVLNAVNLVYTAETKTLVVQATDRYRMVFVKVSDEIFSDADSFSVLVSTDSAKALIQKLRYPKKLTDPEIQLEIHGDKLEMIYYQEIEMIEIVSLVEGNYPDIGKLMNSKEESSIGQTVGTTETVRQYNASFLQDVAKLRDYRGRATGLQVPITMSAATDSSKPTTFWAGDSIVGKLMPIRLPENTPRTVPNWVK